MTSHPRWRRFWMWRLPAGRWAVCSRRCSNNICWHPLRCIIGYMDLRPLHDRVMVRKLEEGEQRRGGIIVPDSAKEKPQQAEVIAVGNGKLLETGERVALDVNPGDRILFGKYSGSEIKIQGSEYLILKEDEILGVLE